MISRYPTTLTRSIASGIPFSEKLRKAYAHANDSKASSSTTTTSGPASAADADADADPWAAVFDDIPHDLAPSAPRRPNTPSRFSSSTHIPKSFFVSNFPKQPNGGRGYASDAKSPRDDSWDHVFEGLDGPSPVGQRTLNIPRTIAPSGTRRTRRKAMTAREISAFDDMFDMIFAAVNKQAQGTTNVPSDSPAPTPASTTEDPVPAAESASLAASLVSTPEPSLAPAPAPAPEPTSPPAIGRTPSHKMADFFGKLRSHSNRMRRTTEDDELLDRKKEAMQLCDTDQELLAWAAREVFHESPDNPAPATPELARYLADPTYPHVLAHLMHVFRTRYRAPHTALALFSHAKRRSIHSYVFGCTAPAYNERLEALWQLEGWSGLATLEAALVEMRANGVEADGHTRELVERVRREVGERCLGRDDETTRAVWGRLGRIEGLVKRKADRRPRKSKMDRKHLHWNEGWKGAEDPNLGEDRLTLGHQDG